MSQDDGVSEDIPNRLLLCARRLSPAIVCGALPQDRDARDGWL